MPDDTTVTHVDAKPLDAARTLARLVEKGANATEIASYYLALAGTPDQALLMLNEATDELDQLASSSALRIRTSAH